MHQRHTVFFPLLFLVTRIPTSSSSQRTLINKSVRRRRRRRLFNGILKTISRASPQSDSSSSQQQTFYLLSLCCCSRPAERLDRVPFDNNGTTIVDLIFLAHNARIFFFLFLIVINKRISVWSEKRKRSRDQSTLWWWSVGGNKKSNSIKKRSWLLLPFFERREKRGLWIAYRYVYVTLTHSITLPRAAAYLLRPRGHQKWKSRDLWLLNKRKKKRNWDYPVKKKRK